MGALSKAERSYLEKMFGDRVTFDKIERKLYGHDIAAMPSLIKPLVGNTMPDAVVQPASEEELVELVTLGARKPDPAHPARQGARPGYGGRPAGQEGRRGRLLPHEERPRDRRGEPGPSRSSPASSGRSSTASSRRRV